MLAWKYSNCVSLPFRRSSIPTNLQNSTLYEALRPFPCAFCGAGNLRSRNGPGVALPPGRALYASRGNPGELGIGRMVYLVYLFWDGGST